MLTGAIMEVVVDLIDRDLWIWRRRILLLFIDAPSADTWRWRRLLGRVS
jgi:hypothetical protein